MGETVRFGVSLDNELLTAFDALCERRNYASRSEALRDVIREALVQENLENDEVDAAGVLTLIYDHHTTDLNRRLNEKQHHSHDLVVASLHVHLDHRNCMETLVLRGKAGDIRELSDELRAMKGVEQGAVSFTTTVFKPA